ncbi:MAG TPA: DUF192 domain-containing protein [Tepidiformaceae bacterium]|nr:DUF192 domain-containing protein [Tepidiformaceae bacterium]
MAERVTVERTGAVLASDLRVASSAWARFRGLMLVSKLGPGAGLDIRPCGSIHMMFMRFAIDAVFYDSDGRVTKVSRGVRPWIGIAFGGRGAKGVIELPRGAAAFVERGHQLEFAA